MVKADLIFAPYLFFNNAEQVHVCLFAIDPGTGRILACRNWSGALLDAPPLDPLRELLQTSTSLAHGTRWQPPADNPQMRHAEAKFVIEMSKRFVGLQSLRVTRAERAIRLSDAAFGLAYDSPRLMGDTAATFEPELPATGYPQTLDFYPHHPQFREIRALRDSGQQAQLLAEAIRVMEPPLLELRDSGSDADRAWLAKLYLDCGQPKRALDLLCGGRPYLEFAHHEEYYPHIARALAHLGRYQECIQFVESRKSWNMATGYAVLVSYRELGDPKNEFKAMRQSPASVGFDSDLLARCLTLGTETGQPEAAIKIWSKNGDPRCTNQPWVQMALVRARVAAGQLDLARSDAQCAWLTARKMGDAPMQAECESILQRLGSKPLERLPVARDYIKLPEDCRFDLLHDQTVPAEHARDVAKHVANFWGCKVEIRPVSVPVEKIRTYSKLTKGLDADLYNWTLLRMPPLPGRSLGTVLLTRVKLFDNGNDIMSSSSGMVKLLSEHYPLLHRTEDPRDLAYIMAISAVHHHGLQERLKNAAKVTKNASDFFRPLPPDVFATTGTVHLANRDLGISPRTGELLAKLSPEELITFVEQFGSEWRNYANRTNLAHGDIARDMGEQVTRATPVIVTPEPVTR